jgi:hypothetical protein
MNGRAARTYGVWRKDAFAAVESAIALSATRLLDSRAGFVLVVADSAAWLMLEDMLL